MMILLSANLSLIIFDWIYMVGFINKLLSNHLPDFYHFYQVNIHENFRTIDLVFVLIFIIEFIFSWALAIVNRLHTKWFFYPFLHFYDLLGCIPVGSFRFLRILRMFSILIRLQNIGLIDLTKTSIFSFMKKYYEILVEEVSDRVVVNILAGLQDELKEGGVVMDRIINDVVKPRQEIITKWISKRIEHILLKGVQSRRQEIHEYIKELVNTGLQKNEDIKAISQVPVMGKILTESIEKTISNVINNMIDTVIEDLGSEKNKILVHDVSDIVIEVIQYKDADDKLNKLISEVVIEAVEEVKKQVLVKKWLMKEQAEKDTSGSEKLGMELLMTD